MSSSNLRWASRCSAQPYTLRIWCWCCRRVPVAAAEHRSRSRIRPRASAVRAGMREPDRGAGAPSGGPRLRREAQGSSAAPGCPSLWLLSLGQARESNPLPRGERHHSRPSVRVSGPRSSSPFDKLRANDPSKTWIPASAHYCPE